LHQVARQLRQLDRARLGAAAHGEHGAIRGEVGRDPPRLLEARRQRRWYR
jgi:hypothetical protein